MASRLPCCAHRDAGPPKLLEATLLGLQAVRARHGPDSRQAAAAAAMLQGTLAEVWAALHNATGVPRMPRSPMLMWVRTMQDSWGTFVAPDLCDPTARCTLYSGGIPQLAVHGVPSAIVGVMHVYSAPWQAAVWLRSWHRWTCGRTPS
jgi:hypothetical protein